MKKRILLILAIPLCNLCCADFPVTFSVGATGQNKDGTAWHADVSTPVRLGGKESVNVTGK